MNLFILAPEEINKKGISRKWSTHMTDDIHTSHFE